MNDVAMQPEPEPQKPDGTKDKVMPLPQGGDRDMPYQFGRRPDYYLTWHQVARALLVRERINRSELRNRRGS